MSFKVAVRMETHKVGHTTSFKSVSIMFQSLWLELGLTENLVALGCQQAIRNRDKMGSKYDTDSHYPCNAKEPALFLESSSLYGRLVTHAETKALLCSLGWTKCERRGDGWPVEC